MRACAHIYTYIYTRTRIFFSKYNLFQYHNFFQKENSSNKFFSQRYTNKFLNVIYK